jgi:hypothetical protein
MVIGSFGVDTSTADAPGEYHVKTEITQCFAIFDTDGENTLTLRTYRGTEGTLIETIVSCGDWGNHEFDFNEDCVVDLADFAIFAQSWLACTTPNELGCEDAR